MAKMRTYKASGGRIIEYYRKQRQNKKGVKRILELDNKVTRRIKNNYKAINPNNMIAMPYILRIDGQWLKNML